MNRIMLTVFLIMILVLQMTLQADLFVSASGKILESKERTKIRISSYPDIAMMGLNDIKIKGLLAERGWEGIPDQKISVRLEELKVANQSLALNIQIGEIKTNEKGCFYFDFDNFAMESINQKILNNKIIETLEKVHGKGILGPARLSIQVSYLGDEVYLPSSAKASSTYYAFAIPMVRLPYSAMVFSHDDMIEKVSISQNELVSMQLLINGPANNKELKLKMENLPCGVTAEFNPDSVVIDENSSSPTLVNLTLIADDKVQLGNYPTYITGTLGIIRMHLATLMLNVAEPTTTIFMQESIWENVDSSYPAGDASIPVLISSTIDQDMKLSIDGLPRGYYAEIHPAVMHLEANTTSVASLFIFNIEGNEYTHATTKVQSDQTGKIYQNDIEINLRKPIFTSYKRQIPGADIGNYNLNPRIIKLPQGSSVTISGSAEYFPERSKDPEVTLSLKVTQWDVTSWSEIQKPDWLQVDLTTNPQEPSPKNRPINLQATISVKNNAPIGTYLLLFHIVPSPRIHAFGPVLIALNVTDSDMKSAEPSLVIVSDNGPWVANSTNNFNIEFDIQTFYKEAHELAITIYAPDSAFKTLVAKADGKEIAIERYNTETCKGSYLFYECTIFNAYKIFLGDARLGENILLVVEAERLMDDKYMAGLYYDYQWKSEGDYYESNGFGGFIKRCSDC